MSPEGVRPPPPGSAGLRVKYGVMELSPNGGHWSDTSKHRTVNPLSLADDVSDLPAADAGTATEPKPAQLTALTAALRQFKDAMDPLLATAFTEFHAASENATGRAGKATVHRGVLRAWWNPILQLFTADTPLVDTIDHWAANWYLLYRDVGSRAWLAACRATFAAFRQTHPEYASLQPWTTLHAYLSNIPPGRRGDWIDVILLQVGVLSELEQTPSLPPPSMPPALALMQTLQPDASSAEATLAFVDLTI